MVETAEREHPVLVSRYSSARHPDRHRGGDVSAAGDARQVVDISNDVFRLKALQHAEAECGRADATARTSETGQAEGRRRYRFRGIVGDFRSIGSVVPLFYVNELGTKHLIERFAEPNVLSPIARYRHIRPTTEHLPAK